MKVRVKMEFTLESVDDVQLPEEFHTGAFTEAGRVVAHSLGSKTCSLLIGGKYGRKWEMRVLDDLDDPDIHVFEQKGGG